MSRVTATQRTSEREMLTGLKQRGSRWFLRRRVPAEFAEAWGKAEVTRALGTSDYKEARKLLPLVWASLDQEFADKQLAIDPNTDPNLDPHQKALGVVAALRIQRDKAVAEGKLQEFNERWRSELATHQGFLNGDLTPTWSLAAHEGIRNGIQAFLTGDGAFAIPIEAALSVAATEENPTVSELHVQWLKHQERAPSTIKEARRAVDRFIAIVGDKRVKAISRRSVTNFVDKLREPDATSPEGMTVSTANTTVSLISALFGLAVKRGYIENNPARGARLKDVRRPREKRREFDSAALNAIFGSPIYTADERPEGGAGEAVFWLPLLALYTGARINELCQLHPDDVRLEGYSDAAGNRRQAWVIRIEHNAARRQRVKTEGSERRIPVHPDLERLGFVQYVQEQAGKSLLFDQLSMGANETKQSGNWGRWFGRQLRNKWGVTDDRMTFHSFRHTFKHHMRQCQIPKDVNDALTGHETGDAADAYGGLSFPLAPLVEGMKAYRVDGFTLPAPPPAFR